MSGGFDDPLSSAMRGADGNVVLAGRYRIVRELGQGAMGVVYLAEDLVMARHPVAIKMPPRVMSRNQRALADLKQEALLARRLTHPNIVTLRTLEESPEGVFLVMDYVDGISLEDALGERRVLSEHETQALFSPLAHALDYAHGQGVLHRDLKPSNILIRKDGTPLLADFGIARELKESVTRLTGRTISGTLPYMSPEQLRGDAPARPQDVYGLAATMYECLSGHAPFFRGDLAYQILHEEPEDLPFLPSPLTKSIFRGLAKDPEDRPRTCAALAHPPPEPAAPVPASAPERVTRRASPPEARPRSWLWPILGGVCLVLLAVGTWLRSRDTAPAAPAAPEVSVTLSEPGEGDFVSTRRVSVSGTVKGDVRGLRVNEVAALVSTRRVSVSGTEKSDVRGLRVNEVAALVEVGSWRAVVPTESDGPLLIRVTDRQGTVLGRRQVTVDTEPPRIEIDAPATAELVTPEPTFRIRGHVRDVNAVTLRANGERIAVRPDGGFEHRIHFQNPGTRHRVALEATDAAGLEAEPVSRTITWRPAPAWQADAEAFVRAMKREPPDFRAARRHLDQARAGQMPSTAVERALEVELLAWEEAPSLALASPKNEAEISGLEVKVRGRLHTNRETDRVQVNGRAVSTDADGRFETTLRAATYGIYRITLTVGDDGGARLPPRVIHVFLRNPAPLAPAWAEDLLCDRQKEAAARLGVAPAFTNDLGMRFVLIPNGTFRMGSPEEETAEYEKPVWWKDERPMHSVVLTKPFYLQVTEVTNEQYRKLVRDHDSGAYEREGERHDLNGEVHPVVRVSWNDATEFAENLSEEDSGRAYRLPTEAEWEYACRAGTTTRFSWGDDESEGWRHANANDPKTKALFGFSWPGWPKDDGFRVTAPVGSFRPNHWGLYDMHGNVWEWCADEYGPYPSERVVDPQGPPGDGSRRVLRGGSWYDPPAYGRSAYRDRLDPGKRAGSFGFRLVSPLSASAEYPSPPDVGSASPMRDVSPDLCKEGTGRPIGAAEHRGSAGPIRSVGRGRTRSARRGLVGNTPNVPVGPLRDTGRRGL